MKKYSDLINEVTKTSFEAEIKASDEAKIRESYIKGEILNVGDSVECSEGIAEIVSRGPNYVTLIKEGKSFKKWITDVRSTKKVVRKRVPKSTCESFTFKGYSSKNFDSNLISIFEELSKTNSDTYAVFNCLVCCDTLLGVTKEMINENYLAYAAEFERANKYLNKLGIRINKLSEVEDWLIEKSLTEGLVFKPADQMKVAKIIATNVGSDIIENDPTETINAAAKKIKSGRWTPEAWKLLGGMLNMATRASIKWNKGIFASHTQKYMELR